MHVLCVVSVGLKGLGKKGSGVEGFRNRGSRVFSALRSECRAVRARGTVARSFVFSP